MPAVFCSHDDCIHWKRMECQAKKISFCEDEGCLDFNSYLTLPEYQETYWIACCSKETNGGKPYRYECKGMKVIIDGIVLYSDADLREGRDVDMSFTDERTGVRVVYGWFVNPDMKAEMIKKLAEKPDVMSLPIYIQE